MGELKKIKAVKDGTFGYFSEKSWNIANPEKNGWKRVGEGAEPDPVDAEEIVVVEIGRDEEKAEEKAEKTREEMMAFLVDLAEKGEILKKPHHALGDKKLKEMYDENTK